MVCGRARSLTVPDPVNRPWLLKAGVHPKVVSERLGHACIGITLDTYSHVMPGMQEEAAEKIDAGLRAALAG
jgi:integrase